MQSALFSSFSNVPADTSTHTFCKGQRVLLEFRTKLQEDALLIKFDVQDSYFSISRAVCLGQRGDGREALGRANGEVLRARRCDSKQRARMAPDQSMR